jgi:hypothetical protein
MMYEYIFVYIVLSLIIIIKIIDFLSETFFPYFFHVHLNILDTVVSSLYTIFGTACMYICIHINNWCFIKFGVEVGVELSIVNALYKLRITDQLYAFTRVVRSQSTLQCLLRRQI